MTAAIAEWRQVELRAVELAAGPDVAPTADAIAALARQLAIGIGHVEEAAVAAINPRRVLALSRIATGGSHDVAVPLPTLLAVPLVAGATRFVLLHSHPSGRLLPSHLDYALTEAVVAAANACGLLLDDHLILAPDGRYVSFRRLGILG